MAWPCSTVPTASIDDCSDGVGRVVKAVDELEAQRDQHGDGEQQERQHRGGRGRAGAGDIGVNAVGHEQQAARQHREENQHPSDIHRLVEFNVGGRRGRGGGFGDG